MCKKQVSVQEKQNNILLSSISCPWIYLPGIDCNNSVATVVKDVSFQVMLIMMVWNLQAKIMDEERDFPQMVICESG
jgi:hypothetical protein